MTKMDLRAMYCAWVEKRGGAFLYFNAKSGIIHWLSATGNRKYTPSWKAAS